MGTAESEARKWARKVKKERGNMCALCGCEPDGTFLKRIEAHHIEPQSFRPDLIYDTRNGIPLCRKCHNYIHSSVWNTFVDKEYAAFWGEKYQLKKQELINCAKKHGWTYPANPPLMVLK